MTAVQDWTSTTCMGEVNVVAVKRLSPSFVRVELGGALLADYGQVGPTWDQRFKLLVDGCMRTYTVRDVLGRGTADQRLVVDLVTHEPEHGPLGPAGAWASRARVGDVVQVIVPRQGHDFGGIEFRPGAAREVVLAGDETAVPAVCAILEQLPDDARGTALLEVPVTQDVLRVRTPAGVRVVWLPRDGRHAQGARALGGIEMLFGLAPEGPAADEVDPDLWETPTYSSSGQQVSSRAPDPDDVYVWVAGESGMVTAVRRRLVRDVGLDRRQVAFMGYWRRGVAMRS